MANKVEVFFEIDGDGKGRATLRSIDTGIDQIGKTARQTGTQVESGLSFLKSAIVVEFFRRGAGAALDFAKAAVDAFNQAQAAALGLQSVARFKGIGGQDALDEVKNLELVKNGLLSITDATTTLKNLLQTGFSLEQSIQLLNRFGDSAAFGRQSALTFGQAIVSTSEGIRNQNSILSDNGGITKNLSVILKERGFELQDLSDKVRGAGAREALYAGLLVETQAQVGDAAKLTGTYAGQTARLEAEQKKLLVSVGEIITKNPDLQKGIEALTNALGQLTKEIQREGSNLNKFLNEAISGFSSLFQIVEAGLPILKGLAFVFSTINQLNPLVVAGQGRELGRIDSLTAGKTASNVNITGGIGTALADKALKDLKEEQALLERKVSIFKELEDAEKKEGETAKKTATERLTLFQTTLNQANQLNSLRLQLAQLEAGGDSDRLQQATAKARANELSTAQSFLARAENAQQKQFALERILATTSDVGSLSDAERGIRQKALVDSIAIQSKVFEENFKRLGDQTNATQENTAGLRAVGNSLKEVDSSLANFARQPLQIIVQDESDDFKVDLGSVAAR